MRISGALALVVGVAMTVAGCGGSSDAEPDGADAPPSHALDGRAVVDIAHDVNEVGLVIASVKVSFRISTDTFSEHGHYRVDAGRDCAGTVIGDAGRSQFLHRGQVSLVRPEGSQFDRLGKKWLISDQSEGSYWAFCEGVYGAMNQVAALSDVLVDAHRVGHEKVGGASALHLRSHYHGGTTDTWVAEDGTTHLLKVTRSGHGFRGTLLFSDFDAPLEVKLPPRSQRVTLAEFRGESREA